MAEDRKPLTPEEQQAALDAWDGEVGMELQEETPFLGQVVADEKAPGRYGPQLHIAVRPVDFTLKGKTGSFHEYYGISGNARSKMGAFLKGLQIAGVEKGTKVGKGELIGHVCWWVKRDISFGRSATGERIVAEGVLVPIKRASDEERERAGEPPATLGEPQTTQQPAELNWTPEQANAVVSAIEGLTPREFQKAVLSKDSDASKLPRELKSAILSGAALRFLTDIGRIELDGDGKVRQVESAGAAV